MAHVARCGVVPLLGLGTWKSKPNEVQAAVEKALAVGYKHIDGAYVYQNETDVGKGIRSCIDKGIVHREELFIVTKLWNTFHEPATVQPACRESLSSLGLSYVDLYLMHSPIGFQVGDALFPEKDGHFLASDVDYIDTWKAMENLVDEGLVKSIGVSNFNISQLERLLSVARIKPLTNQIEHLKESYSPTEAMASSESQAVVQLLPVKRQKLTNFHKCITCQMDSNETLRKARDTSIQTLVAALELRRDEIELHPYFTRDKLVQYCNDKGVTVVAYSPFGAPDRPFKEEVNDPHGLLQDPVVAAIAKKHGKTSAQVLLRYHIQRGIVVIPKSVTPARIVENAKVFDFQLDKEDYDQLAGLNKDWSIRPTAMVSKLQKHKYFTTSDD